MRTRVPLALLAAFSLLTAACGARLSDPQRSSGIALQLRGNRTSTTSTGAQGPVSTDTGSSQALASAAPVGNTDVGTQASTAPTEASTAPSSGPSGPLRASDKGVTSSDISIATLADISGVQPGLFQSAHDAARAATAYINNTGGINGRRVRSLLLDSKTDTGGNRAAMLDACQKAFAVVGSISAFDDGSAKPGQDCGIPDMSATVVNGPKWRATNTYPMFPNGPNSIGVGTAKYIKQHYPQSIKHAAIFYLAQAVTRSNALKRKEGWESIGFQFVYTAEVQVLEADYTRFVLEMRSRGVDYINMVADYQNLVRLQKAMRQQNYTPTVRDWDSVAYDPGYLQLGESAVDGSLVFVNTELFQEASQIPEMQLYLEWLRRSSPGAVPDYFGIYTWSAFRLFQKLAKQIGPDLTRSKLFSAIRATKTWNDYGMTAPHLVGTKESSDCYIYLKAMAGAFKRIAPARGFQCGGGLARIKKAYS